MTLISIIRDTLQVLKLYDVKRYELVTFISLGIIASIFSIFTIYIIFNYVADTISLSSNTLMSDQNLEKKNLLGFTTLQANWVILIILVNFLVQLLTIYYQQKFCQNICHKMALKLIRQFMGINFFTRSNSISDSIRSMIASEAQQFTTLIIMPFLEIMKSCSLLFIGIFAIIFHIEIKLLSVFVIVIIIFIAYFFVSKRIVSKLGEIRAVSVDKRMSLTESVINNLKYVKAYDANKQIFTLFQTLSLKLNNAIAWSMVISSIPKHFIEFLIFIIITLLIIFTENGHSFFDGIDHESLVLSGVITLRILPEMQRIFNGSSRIIYGRAIINNFLSLIDKIRGIPSMRDTNIDTEYSQLTDCVSIKEMGIKSSGEFLFSGVNFDADLGNIVLIKGASGSGKSTILEVIMDMRRLDAGEITYLKSDAEPFAFSYVGQEFLFFPGPVKNTIEILLSDNWLEKELDIIDYLVNFKIISSKVEFQNFLNSDIEKLSGGERQRLAIIIALISPQKFMFLDEPTSNLDLVTKALVVDAVREMVKKQNKCAIVISHDDCFNNIADVNVELK